MAPVEPLELEGGASEMTPINPQGDFYTSRHQHSGGPKPPSRKPFRHRWCGLVIGVGLILTVAAAALLASAGGEPWSSGTEAAGRAALSPPPSPPAPPSASCDDLVAGGYWDWVVPSTYNLTVALAPQHFAAGPGAGAAAPGTFNASATLALRVLRRTRCVVLQAHGLSMRGVGLARHGMPARRLCVGAGCAGTLRLLPAPTNDTWSTDLFAVELGAEDALDPGEAPPALVFEYMGRMGNGTGLHTSQPFAADCAAPGTRDAEPCARTLVVTQLAAVYARTLFPCVDVPRMRAVFNIAVEAPSEIDMMVLSNMPLVRTGMGSEPGTMRHTFAPTPAMPTYLVAIAAGNMVPVKPGSASMAAGMEVTAWTTPGKESRAAYAADAAIAALEFYTSWTGVDQPLTKMDFLAVPGKSGAMENWGLLMFDERRFLHDPATGGAFGAWLAADVVCHETAHQWFGNLVTAADWSQVSFNEGLASWLEYLCLDAVPGPALTGLVLRYAAPAPQGRAVGVHEGPTLRALGTDDSPFRPPMVPEGDADVGTGDVEAYSKPAAFLAMLAAALDAQPGTASLQHALQSLLRARALQNATFDDILVAAAAGVPSQLSDSFLQGLPGSGEPWLRQRLLPLLNASATAGAATLPRAGSPFCATAQLPPGDLSGAGREQQGLCLGEQEWVLPRVSGATAGDSGMPEWLVNPQGVGLYRTLYSPAQLQDLGQWVARQATCEEGTTCTLGIDEALSLSSVLHDTVALVLAGVSPARPLLGLVDDVARALTTLGSGATRYLLLVPALEATGDLARYSPDCAAAATAYAAARLAPPALPALAAAVAGEAQDGDGDATLGALSVAQLVGGLTRLGAAGPALGATLCPALPSTALARLQSGGGGGDQAGSALPPDAEGGVYLAAAAGLPGCEVLSGAALGAALRRCYLELADEAGAERCLLTLPFVEGQEGAGLAWALGGGRGESGGAAASVASDTRRAARQAALPRWEAGLVAAAGARGVEGWNAAATALADAWTALGADRGCSALAAMGPPPAGAGSEAMLTALLAQHGPECSEAVRAGAAARAARAASLAPGLGAEVCAWLDEQGV